MIWGAELGLAIWAIAVLFVGYRGKLAKLAAIVALLPLPLSIMVMALSGMIFQAMEVQVTREQVASSAKYLELGMLVACLIVIRALLRRTKKPDLAATQL
jgi:hypothetical protein